MQHKVLFTASTYSHIRHFHLPYLQAFQTRGWEVHVGCGGTAEQSEYIDKFLPLPFKKKMHAPDNFRAAAMLRREIAAEEYDLVITHTSLAAFFTRLALMGLKNRPKVINMVHGYLFDDRSSFVKRKLLLSAELLTAPCTDLLLTMNRWDYETALRHHLGAEVGFVPGIGVDFTRLEQYSPEKRPALRQEEGFAEEDFVLFYAAEFSPRKSQQVLLRAIQQLPEHVVLVLAGEGALLEECQTLAKSLGIAHRVRFPGYVRDVGRWYAMADAAVSASRSEGLPFNIMEAMYAGLPVVASCVKGHEDLITDGENGLLYPYGDVAACAQAISRLLEEPDLKARLRRAAVEQAKDYSLKNVLPIVMDAYATQMPVEQHEYAATK